MKHYLNNKCFWMLIYHEFYPIIGWESIEYGSPFNVSSRGVHNLSWVPFSSSTRWQSTNSVNLEPISGMIPIFYYSLGDSARNWSEVGNLQNMGAASQGVSIIHRGAASVLSVGVAESCTDECNVKYMLDLKWQTPATCWDDPIKWKYCRAICSSGFEKNH